jgi:hypothetical protein
MALIKAENENDLVQMEREILEEFGVKMAVA